MLADAATATLFTCAPHPLMLADAAAATLFTIVPPLLMLADAAAATLFTVAPHDNFCKGPRTLQKFPQKCQKIAGC